MPHIKLHQTMLYYESAGEGVPIVFIAGLGHCCRYWDQLATLFTSSHRIIVYDPRGMGQSKSSDIEFNLDDLADDVYNLCQQLDLISPYLVGVSLGGLIVQRVASRYPQLAKRIALIATTPKFDKNCIDFAQIPLKVAAGKIPIDDALELMIATLFSSTFLENPNIYQIVFNNFKEMFSTLSISAYKNQLKILQNANLLQEIPLIKCPTLIIGAKEDRLTLAKDSEVLHQNIVNSSYHLIEDCGHNIPLEKPQELHNLIYNFFS